MQSPHAGSYLECRDSPGPGSCCRCKRKPKIKVADKLQSHEGPMREIYVSLRITFGRRKHAQGFKMIMKWPEIKKLPDLSTQCGDLRNYAKSSLSIWLEMKDCFELVRGFETFRRVLTSEILRPVLALRISAAIICKFESNKQTKHNLFPHSQISLHRFPRLQSQSAISFPGKMGRVLWPGYCNIVSGCILYPTFNSFSTFFPVFCDPGQENVCRSQRARWGTGNIVSLEIGSS